MAASFQPSASLGWLYLILRMILYQSWVSNNFVAVTPASCRQVRGVFLPWTVSSRSHLSFVANFGNSIVKKLFLPSRISRNSTQCYHRVCSKTHVYQPVLHVCPNVNTHKLERDIWFKGANRDRLTSRVDEQHPFSSEVHRYAIRMPYWLLLWWQLHGACSTLGCFPCCIVPLVGKLRRWETSLLNLSDSTY